MPASKIENIMAHVIMPRVINLEKMDLIPSQVATYLGILYASPCHHTRGRLMVTNWLSIVEGFMASVVSDLRNHEGTKPLQMSDFATDIYVGLD